MQKNIFIHTRSFLYASMLIILASLIFSGCDKKKDEKPQIRVENTTEIFTPKDLKVQARKSEQKSIKNEQSEEPMSVQNVHVSDKFTVNDAENSYKIGFSNGQLSFLNVNKPVVLINLFQADCHACQTQIKSLTKLAKKYKNKLQVITLSDHVEKADNARFRDLIETTLGLSPKLTTPLSILYKEGHYYTYYEGLVPVEMLQHDIEQAIKK